MCSAEDLKRFFKEADKDNSGELSFSEMAGALRKQGYKESDQKLRQIFSSVDTSGDNQISLKEFLTAMGHADPKMHKEAALRRTFRLFDTDNSGEIDKHDLKKVFAESGRFLSDAEVDRLMTLVDTDGSGTISYEEFIKRCF